MKNLAGNNVAIFLFRFESSGNGVDFILNEGIAADMYDDIDAKLKPLVHACCETLLRYKHLSKSNIIMDGTVLVSGTLEVGLSQGLGKYFPEDEKENLFQDATKIADLLAVIMNRRTQEQKQGKVLNGDRSGQPHDPSQLKKGLASLGKAKRLKEESQHTGPGKQKRTGLRQLRLEDLPADVIASSGYDHRGHCYVFAHKTLGDLGRIILIDKGEQQVLIQAELFDEQESPTAQKKKKIFEEVVSAINNCFVENFG